MPNFPKFHPLQFIGLVAMAFYAAISTEYFAEEDPQGFGDFFHAFYTLFSVIAYSQPMDSVVFNDDGCVRFGAITFVYSYVGIVIIILLQVTLSSSLFESGFINSIYPGPPDKRGHAGVLPASICATEGSRVRQDKDPTSHFLKEGGVIVQ